MRCDKDMLNYKLKERGTERLERTKKKKKEGE